MSNTPTTDDSTTVTTSVSAGRRLVRRLMTVAVAGAAAIGLLATSATAASADPTNLRDICWHSMGRTTLISETLPSGNHSGIVIDSYLYHYTSAGWLYTGVAQRSRGTVAGYWIHSNGNINNAAGFNLPRGSGYYVIRNHVYWASNPSVGSWQWNHGYADDLRGATTYCLS